MCISVINSLKHFQHGMINKFLIHFLSAFQPEIDAAVKVLLDLKAKYKATAGKDWKPGQTPAKSNEAQSKDVTPSAGQSKEIDDLNNRITDQGNTVRGLKEKKAPKVSEHICSYVVLGCFGSVMLSNSLTHVHACI